MLYAIITFLEKVEKIAAAFELPEQYVSRRLKQMKIRPPKPRGYWYYHKVLEHELLFYSRQIWFIPLECNIPGNPGYLSEEERQEIRQVLKGILTPRQRKLSRYMMALKDLARKKSQRISSAVCFRLIAPKMELSESTLKRDWFKVKQAAKEAGLMWYLGRWKLASEKRQKIGDNYVKIDYFEHDPTKGLVIYEWGKKSETNTFRQFNEVKTKRRFFDPVHNGSRRVFHIESDSDLHDPEDQKWDHN